MDEVKNVVHKLESVCIPWGILRKFSKCHSSEGFWQSLMDMANDIKTSKVIPLE